MMCTEADGPLFFGAALAANLNPDVRNSFVSMEVAQAASVEATKQKAHYIRETRVSLRLIADTTAEKEL